MIGNDIIHKHLKAFTLFIFAISFINGLAQSSEYLDTLSMAYTGPIEKHEALVHRMAKAFFSDYLTKAAENRDINDLSYNYSNIYQIVEYSKFESNDLVQGFKDRIFKEVKAYLGTNGKQVTKKAILNNEPYKTTVIPGTWYINNFGLNPLFKSLPEAITDDYLHYLYLDAIAEIYEDKLYPIYETSNAVQTYNNSTEDNIISLNRLKHLFCDSELINELKLVNDSKNIVSSYTNDGFYNRNNAIKTAQALSLNLLLNAFHDDKFNQHANKIFKVVDYFYAFNDFIGDEKSGSLVANARHKRIDILLSNFKYSTVFKISSNACLR